MLRSLTVTVAIWLASLPGLGPVWAQGGSAGEACPPGEVCEAAGRAGAWGLIALGLMFFVVGLMPARLKSDDEEQPGFTRLPILRLLQARLEKERTGWRRFQWPVLGVFFTGLGIVMLAGWR